MHEKIDREKHPLRRRAELRISYGCARTEKNKTQKSLDEVDVVIEMVPEIPVRRRHPPGSIPSFPTARESYVYFLELFATLN